MRRGTEIRAVARAIAGEYKIQISTKTTTETDERARLKC